MNKNLLSGTSAIYQSPGLTMAAIKSFHENRQHYSGIPFIIGVEGMEGSLSNLGSSFGFADFAGC